MAVLAVMLPALPPVPVLAAVPAVPAAFDALPADKTLRAAADAGVSVLGGLDACAPAGPASPFRHSPQCEGDAAAASRPPVLPAELA